MKKKREPDDLFISILLLLLILGTSVFLGYRLRLEGPAFFSRLLGRPTEKPPITGKPAADWTKLDRIRRYIEDQYNGPIQGSKLLEGALKGMVGTLDNSGGQYFNALEFNEILNRNSRTHGTGIQLGVRDQRIIVITTDPGSQGEKAGLLPGDIIFKINDKVTMASEIESVRNTLRSNENRTVQLNILRGDKHEEVNVRLRELVKPGILTQLQGNIGVIRLPGFYLDMGKEFENVVDEMVQLGAKGFILDLRDTPTGQVTEGVSVASQFIPRDGKIVTIRDTKGKLRDFTSNSGKYSGLPLVVLTNGQTEGTAEFVAGALNELAEITVLGEATLGEGRIASYINLPEGEGIKLTTGYLLLPSGAEIQGKGFKPDLEVPGQRIISPDLVQPADSQMNKALEILTGKITP